MNARLLNFLTGVADANAARNNIAKDYMKKCNCIWILAPITRAVDDKTARGKKFWSRVVPVIDVPRVDLLGDAFKMQLMSKSFVTVSVHTFLTIPLVGMYVNCY